MSVPLGKPIGEVGKPSPLLRPVTQWMSNTMGFEQRFYASFESGTSLLTVNIFRCIQQSLLTLTLFGLDRSQPISNCKTIGDMTKYMLNHRSVLICAIYATNGRTIY